MASLRVFSNNVGKKGDSAMVSTRDLQRTDLSAWLCVDLEDHLHCKPGVVLAWGPAMAELIVHLFHLSNALNLIFQILPNI